MSFKRKEDAWVWLFPSPSLLITWPHFFTSIFRLHIFVKLKSPFSLRSSVDASIKMIHMSSDHSKPIVSTTYDNLSRRQFAPILVNMFHSSKKLQKVQKKASEPSTPCHKFDFMSRALPERTQVCINTHLVVWKYAHCCAWICKLHKMKGIFITTVSFPQAKPWSRITMIIIIINPYLRTDLSLYPPKSRRTIAEV